MIFEVHGVMIRALWSRAEMTAGSRVGSQSRHVGMDRADRLPRVTVTPRGGAWALCLDGVRSVRGREDGQLTVLLVGLVMLILMTLGLGWDASNWLIGRRALNDVADGAALAAAGSVDVERFYDTDGRDVVLDEAGATAVVRDLIVDSSVEDARFEVRVGMDREGRPMVTVRLFAPAPTMFLHLVGVTAPSMSAEAVAVAVRSGPAVG